MSAIDQRVRYQGTLQRMWLLLHKVPRALQAEFARQKLAIYAPHVVKLFDSLTPEQRARSILYLTSLPQPREPRLAAAAIKCGWIPILAYADPARYYDPANHFQYHIQVADRMTLALVSWLFPGPLIHLFLLRGSQAEFFLITNRRPYLLDLYDTSSTILNEPPNAANLELRALYGAIGVTHRDLRIYYLTKYHNYPKNKNNLFIYDPIDPQNHAFSPRPSDGEIRIVSSGWVGLGDTSIVRTTELLCRAGIHVHIYKTPAMVHRPEHLADYVNLLPGNPYLHLEEPLFGEEYHAALRQYDFGLSINEPLIYGNKSTEYSDDYLAGCGSSRLVDYIRADLGVICTPQLRFQSLIARHYARTVVSTDSAFLANPRAVLEAALKRLSHAPRKPLESLQTDRAAPRLDAFYRHILTTIRKASAK